MTAHTGNEFNGMVVEHIELHHLIPPERIAHDLPHHRSQHLRGKGLADVARSYQQVAGVVVVLHHVVMIVHIVVVSILSHHTHHRHTLHNVDADHAVDRLKALHIINEVIAFECLLNLPRVDLLHGLCQERDSRLLQHIEHIGLGQEAFG